MKLSVVVPVYNEINTLLEILKRIKAVDINKEIIIVDDFSTDGTRELLSEIDDDNIRIFYNKRNMGKGFSIREGFKHVSGDIVIIQDADLEYYPDEYPLMINKIIEGKADVVYGTRFMGSRRVFHFYHYLGNTILNIIANILYNTNLSDLMTCYKAFRVDVLDKVNLRANRFGIECEFTSQIFKRNLRVYEVPISYDGRDYAEGKKITWKDFFVSVYWLLKCRLESYDIGEDTKKLKNNNRWTYDLIKPYLGQKVFEVGSGFGNISKFLDKPNRKLWLTDLNQSCLDYLKYRFISNPRVEILKHDIKSGDVSCFQDDAIDTVVCVNVLENIDNDGKVLSNINKILESGGRFVLFVPALPNLYGSLDKRLKQFRRYDKASLIDMLEKHGFEIEKCWYHNFIAIFGWFVNSRILKRKTLSSFQISVFDKFIPLFAALEKVIPPSVGMSIIVICKKK